VYVCGVLGCVCVGGILVCVIACVRECGEVCVFVYENELCMCEWRVCCVCVEYDFVGLCVCVELVFVCVY